MVLAYIVIATILISLIAFIGIITFVIKEDLLQKLLFVFVSFAAGTLIGAAFLHLLPEAMEKIQEPINAFIFTLFGFTLFFVLEQFICWHHCHKVPSKHTIKPVSYLILFSDAVHNFIDGLVIAGSFLVSISLGIITSFAIAMHEIPQEIGDFGVLVYGGFSRKKALIVNFISALTAILGGIFGFYLSAYMQNISAFLLPFAAGNFIYISAADLLPEIKHKVTASSILHFLIFISGIILMYLFKFL